MYQLCFSSPFDRKVTIKEEASAAHVLFIFYSSVIVYELEHDSEASQKVDFN